jgi:Mn-dependent DtxR family transcriptional regulator
MDNINDLYNKAFENLLKASKKNKHNQMYLETKWGKRSYRWFFTRQELSQNFLEDIIDIDREKGTTYIEKIANSKNVLRLIGQTEDLYQTVKNLIYLPDNNYIKIQKRNTID